AEFGRRYEPDRLVPASQKRCYEAGQERESLNEHGRRWRQRQKVVDDELEALALEAVKSVAHDVRAAIQPSLVHVHRDEGVQERSVVRCRASGVFGKALAVVQTKPVLGGEPTSDGGLTAATAAADESDVAKPVAEHVEIVAEAGESSFRLRPYFLS